MIDSSLNLPTEDLLALFQSTPDLVCIADEQGYLKNFNPAVPALLQYSAEELLSRPIAHFIHPDDREPTMSRRAKLLKGETMLNFRNRYIKSTGEIIWLEWTSVFLKERQLVLAIAKNITDRKQIEQQVEEEFLKLKNQALRLKSNLEKEKKDVAAELHEDLAQLATAVRVDVDWIKSNLQAAQPEIANRLEHARVTADLLVDTIRRISFSMSPAMLDDLGLGATLEWYCSEFSSSTGVHCAYQGKFNESAIPKDVRLDFFRMCQETLTGVRFHPSITQVKISITQNEGKVTLRIEDNGGAASSHQRQDAGIFSVQDRAASLGAHYQLKNDGKGNNTIVEWHMK